jgi:hypothetical protein
LGNRRDSSAGFAGSVVVAAGFSAGFGALQDAAARQAAAIKVVNRTFSQYSRNRREIDSVRVRPLH